MASNSQQRDASTSIDRRCLPNWHLNQASNRSLHPCTWVDRTNMDKNNNFEAWQSLPHSPTLRPNVLKSLHRPQGIRWLARCYSWAPAGGL
jgi:hypothetical protein